MCTWNLQWWPSMSPYSWCVPGIFTDEQIGLLEHMNLYLESLLITKPVSLTADVYLESLVLSRLVFLNICFVPEMYCTVMAKSVFLQSLFVPEIFSDDQLCLLEELIFTWNLQWWPSLSSCRADLYLESSVMTKSVFLKSWFVPGIFSDDQVYLLEELICTWNLQWWPSLSSWRADLYLESSVMTNSVCLNSWFVLGIFSDDQVCLLEVLICTWNLQWWPSVSS